MDLTAAQLVAIMPTLAKRPKTLAAYLPLLVAAMREFEIVNVERAAAFLAQLAHESGEFRWMEELASGAAYDRRSDLGNTKPEAIRIARAAGTTPGRFWKGHGPIQTTGFDNHVLVGTALGIDAKNNPRLLVEPEHGFRAAGYFWKSHGLNELADAHPFTTVDDAADYLTITRRINGGTKRKKPPARRTTLALRGRWRRDR
jgi:putative chitinase